MMEQGLLEEVRGLFPLRHLKNLQTVGYAELFDYLEHKMTLEEAVDKIKQHTRNYAKRQMTWFKKDPEMRWYAADDTELVNRLLADKQPH
jgi:tRNA dimethylallyltransferase